MLTSKETKVSSMLWLHGSHDDGDEKEQRRYWWLHLTLNQTSIVTPCQLPALCKTCTIVMLQSVAQP